MNKYIITGLVIGGAILGYLAYAEIRDATAPRRIDKYVSQRRAELNKRYAY